MLKVVARDSVQSRHSSDPYCAVCRLQNALDTLGLSAEWKSIDLRLARENAKEQSASSPDCSIAVLDNGMHARFGDQIGGIDADQPLAVQLE